jgi:SpoVK/Ycf46/Vps4 family AAA+-type ATPase
MRKGADCLSKWVGEAERQLRLLFDQARLNQPAIIFFDEIDGLAPARSSKQDQIHASIVATLLALMDGLDDRGQVIVIGATNRIDHLDPALRRPGRFDRELKFTLPSKADRRLQLAIHSKSFIPPLPDKLLEDLADQTAGFCGADLKSLCSEAALQAVRRRLATCIIIYYSVTHVCANNRNNVVMVTITMCSFIVFDPQYTLLQIPSDLPQC